MINKINFLFVTFLGLGKINYAPGTLSSLITTFLLFYFFHILNLSHQTILIGFFIIFFYSLYAISSYIKKKENKDPKEIVIDEIIGQSIPIYVYEISHGIEKNYSEAYLYYIYIFILFRFFDIKKPFPISYFDKNYKNSLGVILDDVIAGIYVILTLIIFMVIKSSLS